MIFEEHIGNSIRGVAVSRNSERISHTLISIDAQKLGIDAVTEATLDAYSHLLIAGCGPYTKQEFLDELLLLGAQVSVSVIAQRLHISLSVLEEHHTKAFRLLACMLQEPRFSAAELKRIKNLIINTLEQDKENAKARSHQAFANCVTAIGHRLRSASQDDLIEATRKITRADVLKAHKALMKNDWIFTFVTAEERRESKIRALDGLRRSFADNTQRQTSTGEQLHAEGRKVAFIPIPSKENIEVNIGGPLSFTLMDKEYAAYSFGLNVLGKWGGFAGRLMSTVREKEGLTYGIYAKTEGITKDERGYWRIMSFFSPAKVEQGITSILREVSTIAEHGITKEEYSRFMRIAQTGQTLLQDSIFSIANDVHSYQLRGLSLQAMHQHKEQLLEVTHTEVNSALAQHMHTAQLSGSFAGPLQSKEKDIRALMPVAKGRK